MWFPVFSILLITIRNVQGNEDITLPIKELHYKISKTVAKIVEESKLLPDPSELELTEKTKKLLEEYIPIDISSGLPEQIELLELKEKADDVKTSEETRKGILDGLESWISIGEIKNDKAAKLDDVLADELDKMEKKRKDTAFHAYRNLDDKVEGLRKTIEEDHKLFLRQAERIRGKTDVLLTLKNIMYVLKSFEHRYFKFFDGFDKIDKRPITFEFLEIMKKVIGEGDGKYHKVVMLNHPQFGVAQKKILSVKEEILVMQELRDSEAIQRMLGLIEKLEGSFKGMQGSGLERLQWKIDYSLRKLTPIRNHLKTLKITAGDLTEPLRKIVSCLQNNHFHDFEFMPYKEFREVKRAFKAIRAKNEEFLKTLDEVEKFRKVDSTVKKLKTYCVEQRKKVYIPNKFQKEIWDETMKLLMDFDRDANLKPISVMSKLDTLSSEIKDLLNKVDFDAFRKFSSELPSKISKVNKFLNCHSTQGIVPVDIKSLMDQPEKVWNFDPRSLQYALEVVYSFKEAHQFLVDQKPATTNQFPLTLEEVSEVSEGFRILEAILNFQKFWAKNSGNFSSTLADELSHLEDISKIQFSPDPHLDSIINFYNSTQYQGGQRTQILKTLEAVRDTSNFAVKLEKMNEAIRKYLGPEPQGIEEEELIDCFENTCPLSSLPEVIRKNL